MQSFDNCHYVYGVAVCLCLSTLSTRFELGYFFSNVLFFGLEIALISTKQMKGKSTNM